MEKFDLLKKQNAWQLWINQSNIEKERVSEPLKQDLTHQRIIARFWEIKMLDEAFVPPEESWLRIKKDKINDYAFPKVIDTYLRQKFLTLSLF